jgi:hypothetical protein
LPEPWGQSLAKIGQSMRRWGIELQLLDGQMYAQLVRLLDEKAGALGMLLHVMTRRKLTLDLHAVLERSIESPGFQELIRRRELVEQEMMKNAVSTTVEWGSDLDFRHLGSPQGEVAARGGGAVRPEGLDVVGWYSRRSRHAGSADVRPFGI